METREWWQIEVDDGRWRLEPRGKRVISGGKWRLRRQMHDDSGKPVKELKENGKFRYLREFRYIGRID